MVLLIPIAKANMTIQNINIEEILQQTCTIAINKINNDAIQYSRTNSSQNELFLVNCLNEAFQQQGFKPEDWMIYENNSHGFPDVLIRNTKIGIELKGAMTGNTFNGNSIFGSTLRKGLDRIFILYWISDQKLVGFDDYFNCVEDAVVTHSPRFRLKINLPATERMFGQDEHQVGSIQDVVFNQDGIQVDKILTWMRDKAVRNNESPWWLTLTEDEDVVMDTISGIKIGKTSLSHDEYQQLCLTSYIFFPEILSSARDKYSRVTAWGISVHGLVINRDFFSAGGRQTLNPISSYTTTTHSIAKSLHSFIELLSLPIKIIVTRTDLAYLGISYDDAKTTLIKHILQAIIPILQPLTEAQNIQQYICDQLNMIIQLSE